MNERNMRQQASSDLLGEILEQVSRSFYLTLKVLPRSVRSQIGLAYLLARTSDTIADTELLPSEARLTALSHFRDSILGPAAQPPSFASFAQAQASAGERTILERLPESIGLLRAQSPGDQGRIRHVLDTIISGQELDLRRFAGASEGNIIALRTDAELDDYTYRVAGCVGEFWTEMTLAYPLSKWTPPSGFRENGIRFGKGLQLVNILRDLPRDLRQGRCYLPADALQALGLAAADLLNPANQSKVADLHERWLQTCEAHLEAGWKYTCAIPVTAVRLRLACAWPLLIATRTVRLLRTRNFLDPAQRLKIPRGEVKSIMMRSIALYPLRRRWEKLFETV
ncbi:MAG TPA: phytoene/squalene synthase family protein [Methylomirabilota bacterium]|nr:phytoene/squalene synthase family protein [Methylomirabilota bacterium]